MKKFKKTIGILGGIGPLASAETYMRLLLFSQKYYHSVQDYEYPHIILNSINIEGLDETGITDNQKVQNRIIKEIKILEKAGSDVIFIACNTVHLFYESMCREINIPILNLIEMTCDEVMAHGHKKIGILSSSTTNRLKLYKNPLNRRGITVMAPDKKEQQIIDSVIMNIMGGKNTQKDFRKLEKISKTFLKKGAEAVVVGCTELPIIINQEKVDFKVFDSMNIALKAALQFAE